ncbi:PDGFRL, partial [Cervus elaphus hippelaphus]
CRLRRALCPEPWGFTCEDDGAERDGCRVPALVTGFALVDSVKQHERYGQLTLVNSTAADTGEFSCWGQLCTGYVCRRDEAKTGSTYIFFTEKGELFVPSPSHFDVVYLNPDRQAVVPCRVTVLSAKPLLLSPPFDSHELLADLLDSSHYKWNVWGPLDVHPILDHQGRKRRGIIKLQVVDRAGLMLVGQLKKGRDVPYLPREENTSVGLCLSPLPMDVLSRHCPCSLPVPSGPPSTTILASANKVKGGDDVSVLCTVLGEPDVEDERPVTIQDSWRLIHRGLGHTTRISQSVLSIEDFETIDAGYYICTAQNLQGQTTVATTVESS